MARTKDPAELSVEDKLKNLYQLQTMLSEIDKIKTLRGELPLEVQDLEDEIEGLTTRIEKIQSEIESLKREITERRGTIESANQAIAKYKEQMDNVRNNREYDSLNKEIEFQELDVELNQKKIREAEDAINRKTDDLSNCSTAVGERRTDLDLKQRQRKRNCVSVPRIWNCKSSPVCWLLSSAFVATHVTDWVSSMFNVMPAVAASTRFHHSVSLTFVCVRRLSYVNIADAL